MLQPQGSTSADPSMFALLPYLYITIPSPGFSASPASPPVALQALPVTLLRSAQRSPPSPGGDQFCLIASAFYHRETTAILPPTDSTSRINNKVISIQLYHFAEPFQKELVIFKKPGRPSKDTKPMA